MFSEKQLFISIDKAYRSLFLFTKASLVFSEMFVDVCHHIQNLGCNLNILHLVPVKNIILSSLTIGSKLTFLS